MLEEERQSEIYTLNKLYLYYLYGLLEQKIWNKAMKLLAHVYFSFVVEFS